MTTRTKVRRAPAVLAILLAGTTACAGCQGHATGSPSALAAGNGAAADGATATSTAAASGFLPGAASTLTTRSPASTASATPAVRAPSRVSPLAGKVVALDPGHNGGDASHATEIAQLVPQGFGLYKACDTTGTESPDGYTEHAFNFQVALLVKALLQQRGITVVMTRTNDTGVGPCVDQRAAIGNNAHAAAAVSIHADGGPVGGHGYQLLEAVQTVGGSTVDAASQRLAANLHTTFDRESGLTTSTYIGTDGYEPRDDIAGLNLTTVPKILVECGNMQNSGDLAIEESASGRQHIAAAIADGIIAFLSSGR